MGNVLIAMSGGVDSSVAAKIMVSKGYSCIGATMKLFDSKSEFFLSDTKCSSEDAINDAKSVASKLSIPYYVFPFEGDFEEKVIKNFVSTYENGGTPNPCIECNKNLKFKALFDKAKELGCDKIATGHYAHIEEINGRFCLKKAKDLKKDQSYVLYSLTQDELSHTIFPIGNLDKEAVRQIASDNDFENANRKESQDICFIPDGDYASFIERYTKKKYKSGNFIDKDGNILGKHKGIIRYTIGQRKGLGLALPEPMFVQSKNLKDNTVVLCKSDELFSENVTVKNFNWVSIENPKISIKAKAKVRYNMTEAPCTVLPNDDGTVTLIFDSPQRAITSGQSAVVYDNDYVLGGGIIV